MAKKQSVAISGGLAKVYFVLLKHGKPMGVREVQQLMGLNSPESAKYYLTDSSSWALPRSRLASMWPR